MKTTIEIPDPLFRKAKSRAAERGQTLREFVTDALQARLAKDSGAGRSDEPKWMGEFGRLRRRRKETDRIRGSIAQGGGGVASEARWLFVRPTCFVPCSMAIVELEW